MASIHRTLRISECDFSRLGIAEITIDELMLLAALSSVVIASCYNGDTCTTTTGERVQLACIDTPELTGKRAQPLQAALARDYLKGLAVGKKIEIRRITEDRYGRTVAELLVGETNVQGWMVASSHAEFYQRYAHQCPWAKNLSLHASGF